MGLARLLRNRRREAALVEAYRAFTDEDSRRLEFYRQFVEPDSIVYDIGANVGNRTKIFARLASKVVAFEPQIPCYRILRRAARSDPSVVIENLALGAEPGEAEISVSNASTLSSMSPEFIEAVQGSGRFDAYRWVRKQEVRVETLDAMIARHGCPSFIKTDVEGFEHQVLAGLHTPVTALSIEFVPEIIANTHACIDHLTSLGAYEYQLSVGESMSLSLEGWVDGEGIRGALAKVGDEEFGDVYARVKRQG